MRKFLVIGFVLMLPTLCFGQKAKPVLTTEDFVEKESEVESKPVENATLNSFASITNWTQVSPLINAGPGTPDSSKKLILSKHLRTGAATLYRISANDSTLNVAFITDGKGLRQLDTLLDRAIKEQTNDRIGSLVDLTESSIDVHGAKSDERVLLFFNNQKSGVVYFSLTLDQVKNIQERINKTVPKE
ncbi:MAG: hypothetical protein AB1489_26135 [Acidobacteriota bacterium]